DDARAAVRGDQAELAAVPEGDPQPARLQAPGEVDQHRVGVVGQRRFGTPRGDLVEYLGEGDRPVTEATVVDVARPEAGDERHRAPGAGHRDGEQAFPAGFAERAEVAEHAAVRG